VSRWWHGTVACAVLVTASTAPAAHAAPDAVATGCHYAIATPTVTNTDGAALVSTSIAPSGCAPASNPSITVACLRAAPDGTAGRCTSVSGAMAAYVSYPYRPGATYTVTGSGCTATVVPSRDTCQSLGPVTATL
jgi:hypothetical protein